jgi:ABC-type transport system involved in multi-copper enzyme maturation permease subunit
VEVSLLGPIFVREWLTVPRRSGNHVRRSAYLALLWVLGLTAWQATVGWDRPASLGVIAQFGFLLFEILSFTQLVLVPSWAALSAVNAIAQEKDRHTFVLLLLTDLRNHEIVLGKLFGSLLPMLLFLVGSLPVLALTLLLGGVAVAQILQVSVMLAATAWVAGSLGLMMALWRDRTFPALALTLLAVVVYLCLVRTLPDGLLVWFDPIEALHSILEPSLDMEQVLVPAYGYAAVMGLLGILLNVWGIMRLRVWNSVRETRRRREFSEEDEPLDKDRSRTHASPGSARRVWTNPILWREMRTRAYGRRPLLIQAAYVAALGLIGYVVLSPQAPATGRLAFAAAFGLVPVTLLSLLLITAQAVTAITSEHDSRSLDLLLATDLTPREFIFGKLGGIAYNSWIYVLPPLVLAAVYGRLGLLAVPPKGHPELLAGKNFTAALCLAIVLLVVFAFAMVFGLFIALRTEKSRPAIGNALGTVFFLSVGTLVCVYLILISGRFEYQITSFWLFIAIGIGGLWWVLSGDRPSRALNIASASCPIAVFYAAAYLVIGKPGSTASPDPLWPTLAMVGAFGFTITAMLYPLLGEFDVALGRTKGGGAG